MEPCKRYFSHIKPTKTPDFPILWMFVIPKEYAIVYNDWFIESNQLYTQWLCGNSCTRVYDLQLHIPGTNEPKSAQQANQGEYYVIQVLQERTSCTQMHECHKATVVTTRKAHSFHDFTYIMPIFLLWNFSTLCVVNHLWPRVSHPLLYLLSTLWFIGTSNV